MEQHDLRICPGCGKEKPKSDMVWTYDRYGNPWKFCCGKCESRIASEIAKWEFDATDAGESLNPEDY